MTAATQDALFADSDLDWRPILEPTYLPAMSLDEKFELFHNANPAVFQVLRRMALDLVRSGRTRIGAKMLVEAARWNSMLHTVGEPWKLNNSLTSRYARLLAATEPELSTAFETRSLARVTR